MQPVACNNCGSELQGAFCHRCGQLSRTFIKMFPALVRDMARDTFAYDARVWRTLRPLMFSPGFLSSEYVSGRRARYSPPFRLYVVVSLLAFLMVSFLVDRLDVRGSETGRANVSVEVDEASLPNYTGYAWLDREIKRAQLNMDHVRADPRRFLRTVTGMLPQMMFLLLPVFAMIMAPLYLFARRYYVEHLILLTHNHAFIFIAMLLSWPLSALRGILLEAEFFASGFLAGALRWLVIAIWIWVPVYLFISMKRFYRQGWILTTLKYFTLGTAYFFLFWFAVGGVMVLGLLRL